jgi:two-component system response regulator
MTAAAGLDPLILVVDDNEDHRELIVAALAERTDRARIVTAPDGDAALDFLFAQGAQAGRDARRQPRLVLLDMKMGGMDGLAVLQAIRADARTAALPVVVLSSGASRDELDRCYAAGANSVVRKSIDFNDLKRKMEKVYEFWITVNEANRHSRV